MTRSKIYIGVTLAASRVLFRSTVIPTEDTHGHEYRYVIGPFVTMRGARHMQEFGFNSLNCVSVQDAEEQARTFARHAKYWKVGATCE